MALKPLFDKTLETLNYSIVFGFHCRVTTLQSFVKKRLQSHHVAKEMEEGQDADKVADRDALLHPGSDRLALPGNHIQAVPGDDLKDPALPHGRNHACHQLLLRSHQTLQRRHGGEKELNLSVCPTNININPETPPAL